jgi:hypothetical protein
VSIDNDPDRYIRSVAHNEVKDFEVAWEEARLAGYHKTWALVGVMKGSGHRELVIAVGPGFGYGGKPNQFIVNGIYHGFANALRAATKFFEAQPDPEKR